MRFRSRLNAQLRAFPLRSVSAGVRDLRGRRLEEGEDPTSLLGRVDRALSKRKQEPPSEPTGVREPRRPKPSGGASSVRKPLEEDV